MIYVIMGYVPLPVLYIGHSEMAIILNFSPNYWISGVAGIPGLVV